MSIRQRGYPGGDQLAVLQMHCDQARYVYNLGLEHRELAYRHKRSFAAGDGYRDRHPGSSFAAQFTLLTEARREFDWLREGSTVVQSVPSGATVGGTNTLRVQCASRFSLSHAFKPDSRDPAVRVA